MKKIYLGAIVLVLTITGLVWHVSDDASNKPTIKNPKNLTTPQKPNNLTLEEILANHIEYSSDEDCKKKGGVRVDHSSRCDEGEICTGTVSHYCVKL